MLTTWIHWHTDADAKFTLAATCLNNKTSLQARLDTSDFEGLCIYLGETFQQGFSERVLTLTEKTMLY